MKYVAGLIAFLFAGGVLVISIVNFSQETAYSFVMSQQERGMVGIDTSTGIRLGFANDVVDLTRRFSDRIRLRGAHDETEKTNMQLEIAYKRLDRAKELWEQGRIDSAITTTIKAQTYLMEAFSTVTTSPTSFDEPVKATLFLQAMTIEEQIELLRPQVTAAEMDVLNRMSGELFRVQEAMMQELSI
jgi:hypothetical protein